MRSEVITGDCIDALRAMPDASIDAVVTDPPYGLSQHMADDTAACLRAWVDGREYRHGKGGFMGRTWDAWVPGPEVWREVLRVLRPGGHALVFAGTRTVDLMGVALRLSGFEIRDSLHWIYGTGFPKSHNIGKAIDKAARGCPHGGSDPESPNHGKFIGGTNIGAGASRWIADSGATRSKLRPATPEAARWEGWGTALKPAHEPIILARKPLSGAVAANVLQHGTGGLNVDGCRVATDGEARPLLEVHGDTLRSDESGHLYGARAEGSRAIGTTTQGRWPPNIILTHAPGCPGDKNGAGCVDGCAVGELGAQSGAAGVHSAGAGKRGDEWGHGGFGLCDATSWNIGSRLPHRFGDTGTAARFFPSFHYCPKASRSEREAGLTPPAPGKRANRHPTVKPIEMMRWLARLVTPPGGTVLDPFTGSGTTGCAAALEGFAFVGCEQDPEHADLARRRIAHWAGGATVEPERQASRPAGAPAPSADSPQLDLFGGRG